jgi:hypothetical protein
MSCSGSTYCFTNTGNNLINDTYISGGTHNSNLYYTGVTNNLFIYYSTTNNEWCLSTALDGSCLMSGDSPGPYKGCPDFSNFYFSEGLCPTPTPTPTSAVDCSDLDFEALFDCDVTPEPSPTSTPTPTPTPTITPTSTDLCGGVDIIATIESITPTPSPTPTITPTTSSPVVRPCTFSGDVTFNVIDGDIVCPYSFEFQDCYNGATYLTTSQVSSPSGGELEDFDIFNADVNGERRCISFIKINLLEIGGDVINLISGPIGKSNEGDCIYCGPSPSVTPTSTVTPTPTPTPTLPILGIQLEECCNGTSFILENYFGTNLTLGETYYYPFTGGTDICATVVPYTGLGLPYNYIGVGSPVLMPNGCDYLECPSCGDESYYVYRRCDDIKYWLVQTVSGSTITPGEVEKAEFCWEFQYISVGLPNLDPQYNIINYTGNYFLLSTTGVYDNCDDCNTPCNSNWNLDCIELNNSVDVTEIIGTANATSTQVWIDESGTRLYSIEQDFTNGFTINQYSISTPNDITSTITYIGTSPSLFGSSKFQNMVFSDDGSKVYIQTSSEFQTDKTVRQHSLITNWDISTMSVIPDFSLQPPTLDYSRGICFNKTGDIFYMGYTGPGDDQYLASWNLSTNWDLSTAGGPTTSNIESLTTNTFGVTTIISSGLDTLIQFGTASEDLAFRNGISVGDLFDSEITDLQGTGPISSSNSNYIYNLQRYGTSGQWTWELNQYLTNV